ncbi:chloride intracellular channel protein 5-like [Talpa occidentalis]|uniref:chloride intracellular channel protein 5-like n=1 Tax=Talpa occidentalis TaxID=50954 RepID=UPI0023F702FA|nr:chloride intracellular channel protein 5-like [Talpa occidentalis]
MYELPDQPEENEGALYDDVCHNLGSESNLYATQLETETHEYDSLSACVVQSEENNLISSQPEYDLPYEKGPEDLKDLQPGELQEDGGMTREEIYLTPEDEELDSENPQENGSRMKEDPLSMQESTAFSTLLDSPACYSADDNLGKKESASENPEISLYVKVVLYHLLYYVPCFFCGESIGI